VDQAGNPVVEFSSDGWGALASISWRPMNPSPASAVSALAERPFAATSSDAARWVQISPPHTPTSWTPSMSKHALPSSTAAASDAVQAPSQTAS